MARIQTNMTETEARNVLRREYGDSSPETVFRAYAADTVRTKQIRLAALGLMGQAELSTYCSTARRPPTRPPASGAAGERASIDAGRLIDDPRNPLRH